MAIIAAGLLLAIALFLPATRSSPEAARRARCKNNLDQIALALRTYGLEHGALPPAYTVDAQGLPLHSWRTLILPYLHQESLYRTIDLAKPWDDLANAKALQQCPDAYRCPNAGAEGVTSYLAVVGPACGFLPDETRPLSDVADDRSTTLMVVEAGDAEAVPWMAPRDADESLVLGLGKGPKLHHNAMFYGVFVDMTVRALPVDLPAEDRRSLMTISGGEKISSEEVGL